MKPQFSLPPDLGTTIRPAQWSKVLPQPLYCIMKAGLTKDALFMHVLSCIVDLNAIAAFMESEYTATYDSLWQNYVYLGLQINPVAHRLLDTSAQAAATEEYECISEALRLGAVLWIIWVKRRCRSYPGTPTAYVSKLLNLLSRHWEWEKTASASDMLSIRLWLLVLCGLSSSDAIRGATIAMEMLNHEMQQLNGDVRNELMRRVHQMPWMKAFEAPCRNLLDLVTIPR